jgi:hypothetical protein
MAMPEEMFRKMKAGGVDNPYALLNAAGAHGKFEDEGKNKALLSRYMKRKKKGRKHAKAVERKAY